MSFIMQAITCFSVLMSCASVYSQQEGTSNMHTTREYTSYIPRDILFSNPEKSGVNLSPDGNYISYIAPRDGVKNIYIAPREKPQEGKAVTQDTHRGIQHYAWAYDNKHILYFQDHNGDENWCLYALNIHTLKRTPLTPEYDVHATLQQLSQKDPHHILVAINERRADYHDIYKINLESGHRSLVFYNDKYRSIHTGDDLSVWCASITHDDGGATIYRIHQEAPDTHTATVFKHIPADDIFHISLVAIDADNHIIYYTDAQHHSTDALYAYYLTTGEKRLMYQAHEGDISDVLFHQQDHHLQAVQTEYLRLNWHPMDERLKPIFHDMHTTQAPADIKVASRSLDDTRWIIAYIQDTASPSYYLLNRETQELTYLFQTKPQLDTYHLSSMTPCEITARDGMILPSYLTIPHIYSNTHKQKKPQQPLPLVLLVHGGPHARDNWGMNATHQWLADRGYAVLSVNYRGSVGCGKQLASSGFGEWAGKMHDDLIDAVQWAIDNGIADKNRIAIMGGSYGGYATLVGMTMTPDVFACGIDIVGPSNVATLLQSIPPYWKPVYAFLTHLAGGDPATKEGRDILAKKSPITYVDQIRNPLFIVQGKNDPRVKKTESDQIVQAMKEKQLPVTYAVYPDEGHGFARPENRISFYALAEQFLHEHLGGGYEPMHDELSHTSLQLERYTGAETQQTA